MSGFDLVPVDGGEPVHVPPGETVLGRGPFLQVGDRRVSRHHGLLENVDGRLRLKPTHLNPCFIQSSLCDDPQPLQKDEWHTLSHGDFFSLLPGHLIFQVEAIDEDPPTPRNSQMFEVEGEAPASGEELEQALPPDAETPDEAPSDPSIGSKQGALSEKAAAEEKKMVYLTSPESRKRVLPTWMMAAATATSKKAEFTPKVPKAKATTSSPRIKPVRVTPKTPTSPEEAQSSSVEKPRKRRWNHREEPPQTKSDSPSHRSNTGSHQSEDGDDPASVSVSSLSGSEQSNRSLQASETRKTNQNNLPASSTSTATSTVRTPCQYGKDCYRKNPLHFQECSHPGDPDYQEEEEKEDDKERPECPYGTDCYRKNPLHWKEYKHTKRPGAPPTRAVTKRNYRIDDDKEEDEDQYEDSFIDDESLEGGDDSDYVPPPDSDESAQEDSQRLREEAQTLRQEAKEFLKRSK